MTIVNELAHKGGYAAVDEFSLGDHTPEEIVRHLRQTEKAVHGEWKEAPTREAEALLDVWQSEEDGSDAFDWKAEYKRQAAVPALNDAELSGDDCPEWQALTNAEIHVTFGEVRPGRKGTPDNKWNAAQTTWYDVIEGNDSARPWGLSRHVESPKKDGSGYVFGACDTYRRASSVKAICALAFDVDSGHLTLDEALKIVRREDVAAILYSTHSHLVAELELKHAKVAELGPVTDESVRVFLTKQGKLAPHVIASATVTDACAETPDGWVVRVQTDPIPKFRIIFPIAEGDVRLTDLGATQPEAQDVFKRKVLGLADKLGIETDPATLDVSRFFFAARHRRGAEWRVAIHRAPPICFADVPLREADATPRKKKRQRVEAKTPDGDTVNVTGLYGRYARRWMMAEIAEECGLGTSVSADNGGGKFHIVCPFADGHTNSADDTATFAINAEDSETGYAIIKCLHGSCQGRHMTEYLAAWIESGELDPVLLEDADFMSPVPDQGESKFLRLTPGETLGTAEARAFLRDNLEGGQVRDGAEADAIALLEGMGVATATALTRVAEAVSDVERQLAARIDRGAPDDSEAPASLPHVLDPLFDEELVDADGFILKPANAGDLYRSYGINTDDEDQANKAMRLEVRDQIFHSMDARFDYVVLDGEAKIAIRPESGQRVRLWGENTLNKLYVNRGAKYLDVTGKTSKVVTIKPAEVFIGARERETFIDTCFEPDAEKAALAAMRGAFNLWTGFAATPIPGDWSLLREHIRDILCDGNEDHFNFVMTFVASLFQRPGVKIPSALALIGEQGTGKSKVFDWVRLAIGASALKVSSMRHLTGNFNAHLDGLILLVCEEAFWAGQKGEGGVLKDLISSETLQIEGKFQNVVERPNYVNKVFISNNAWVVPTDGKDARRFFVLECSDAKKQDGKYFGAIDDQMENGGLEAMMHELMHWDPSVIGGWEALRNPPETDARRRQIALGLSGPPARLVAILEAGVLAGRTPDGDSFHYDLSDDTVTDVARAHLVAALDAGGKGNLTDEMRRSIDTFLGPDADHGDNKVQITYCGEHRGDDADMKRVIKKTEDRVRYVRIPPLSSLKDTLAAHGVRG